MAEATRYMPKMIEEYTKKGYWGTTTPCAFWDRNAEDCPDKEVIVDSKTRLTWSQAKRWIDRLALEFVESGIKRDEMIVLQLPPLVEGFLLRVLVKGRESSVYLQHELCAIWRWSTSSTVLSLQG